MEQTRLISRLRDFGLNSYESKLWVALLSKGISTAGELSDVANVPRSRSYDVLESLRKKGFIIAKKGKPLKYCAIPPEEVIKNTKQKVKDRTKKQMESINWLKTKKIFNELENIYNLSSDITQPREFAGSFKGKTNIKNQIQFIIKNTKKSIYISETEKGLISNLDFLTKTLPNLERNKVDIKIMANIDKNTFQKQDKIKIKNTKLLNRYYLSDGNMMLFMLFDDYNISLLINTKSFINSVEKTFNKHWANSDFVE